MSYAVIIPLIILATLAGIALFIFICFLIWSWCVDDDIEPFEGFDGFTPYTQYTYHGYRVAIVWITIILGLIALTGFLPGIIK